MLQGVFTAIITPFNEDDSVNYETLAKLIEFNIYSTAHDSNTFDKGNDV